ncbi:MinD/ParA family ATP-binding protein [Pseudonocardia sp. GCM10023141]|uniref:MinD/ParA family ATP-binding protein n=1 Tax=Pseudonocardia sp. GCM10023141 TaxID=3252653 RepID=UPI00360E5AA4
MTQRESDDDPDYPDGSVGRYVRERWGAVPARASRPYVAPVEPAPVPEPEPEALADEPYDEAEPGLHTPPSEWRGPIDPFTTGPVGPIRMPHPEPEAAEPAPPLPGPPPAASPPLTPPLPTPRVPSAGPPSQPFPAPERVTPVPEAARTPPRGTGRWTEPGAVAAQEAQRARSGSDRPGTDLSSARLLRPTKRPPQSGWRRAVYLMTGRMFNPGESPLDIRRRELTARVNQPLLGCYKIAMLSLKGGVGKTTVTATLGATFSSLRGDRVVAVDANPDRGTLSQKIPLETSATVRHLLRDAQRVRRYTDVRAYTSQGPSRLEVLASEQDPAVSEAFSEDDYRRTVNLLEHFYNIVLTDCGTGLMHSAMYGVLGVADQLIIVSSGSIDGARSASATMDWLDAHGHGDLVSNSVAVINCVHRSAGGVDLDRVAEHFAARCRTVVKIPFDAHLEEGAEVDLDRLEPGTRMALLELAASVADAFEGAHTT